MTRRPTSLLLTLLALLLPACAGPVTTDDGYPADFALSLLVDTGEARTVYHLHPDRDLHAATGDGVTLRTHTPRTARLSDDQVADVYLLAEAALIAARAPAEAGPPLKTAEIKLTGHRQSRSARFPGEYAPAELMALTAELDRARGVDP